MSLTSFFKKVTEATSSTESELLDKEPIAENAISDRSEKFTIGPSINEAVGMHKFGAAAHQLHFLDMTNTDIFVIRQSMMLAFYKKMKSASEYEPASRDLKDTILKESLRGK